MTKEDPTVMNAKVEHHDNDKNFTEKLGSKLKKTIKNSSSKIKKGLDKTTNTLDGDSDKKGTHMNDYDYHHSRTPLTEDNSEPYDINYNDPYFREYDTSNRYKFTGATKYDRDGKEISKTEKEHTTSKSNGDYYDEFRNYTTTNKSDFAHPDPSIPTYSEIRVENHHQKATTDDQHQHNPEYITKNMKSLNLGGDSAKDSTYQDISKTLESRENGHLSTKDEKKTHHQDLKKDTSTTIAPPPPLPSNLSSSKLNTNTTTETAEHSGSGSETEKKPIYERAMDSAKGMMGTVMDKLTPNKKDKVSGGDIDKESKESDQHLKPGYYDTTNITTTYPNTSSEVETFTHVGTAGDYNDPHVGTAGDYNDPHLNSTIKLKKEAEKEAKIEKEKEKEKEMIKEREEANRKAEEETLLYPNMQAIPVNEANSSVINSESLKASQFSKVVIVAIDSSESSRYAVNWALNHFNKKNDLVVFINVRDSIPSLNSDSDDKNRSNSHELLKDYLKIYQDLDFSCRAIAMKGEPKVEIVRKANELGADLLIMGSRGMGAFKKIFIGSVSEYCVNNAQCPVLIVKNKPKSS